MESQYWLNIWHSVWLCLITLVRSFFIFFPQYFINRHANKQLVNIDNRSLYTKVFPIDLSVSPAPLVTVAPSDKQTELLTVSQWQLQCENLVPRCFCTILYTEGHQMGIKYSMEGFIKYLIINTKGNSKRDHNASWRSLILRSVITIADDNMQDQHCSCLAGYD